MINDASSQVDTNLFATRYRNIAVLWAGTNDMYYDEKLTAETLHGYIRDWCEGRKAAGLQVVVCTITPRPDPRIAEIVSTRMEADIAADPRLGDADDELNP